MWELTAPASSGFNLIPLYYLAAILTSICGGLWALKRYSDNQRESYRKRGVEEQKLLDRLDANTKAADKNTSAIQMLSGKFDSFSSDVGTRLTLIDYRINRLEESNGYKPNQVPPR